MSTTVELSYSSTQHPIGSPNSFFLESTNEGQSNEVPEAYALVFDELGSMYGHGRLMEQLSLNPLSLQVTSAPLARLDLTRSMSAHFVALCALTACSAMGANWGATHPPPATVVSWDPTVQRLQAHPTMSSPEVAEFLQLRPDADIEAIRKHFDLLQSTFSDVGGRTWRYWHHIDHDDGQPYLFLTMQLPDEALEFNELMGREHQRLAKVIASPLLQAASEYHIVSAA